MAKGYLNTVAGVPYTATHWPKTSDSGYERGSRMDEERVVACDAHHRTEMGNQHASQGPVSVKVAVDGAAIDSRS